MNAYFINGTYDTPSISFIPDEGKFLMSGRSLPPNVHEFYLPVLTAIDAYLKTPKEETIFEFKMDFINSSSSKILQDLFKKLDDAFKNGHQINVKWHYKHDDYDMRELGEDLTLSTTFPYEAIIY
ncbi:MAG: DUF1987 domain-containing protein [Bacteroidales bacterium]|nr:DUF1987 domain-containing protein [Bacteroidales bacterium]